MNFFAFTLSIGSIWILTMIGVSIDRISVIILSSTCGQSSERRDTFPNTSPILKYLPLTGNRNDIGAMKSLVLSPSLERMLQLKRNLSSPSGCIAECRTLSLSVPSSTLVPAFRPDLLKLSCTASSISFIFLAASLGSFSSITYVRYLFFFMPLLPFLSLSRRISDNSSLRSSNPSSTSSIDRLLAISSGLILVFM